MYMKGTPGNKCLSMLELEILKLKSIMLTQTCHGNGINYWTSAFHKKEINSQIYHREPEGNLYI